MKLLAMDTSSEGCSAALLIDGSISERFELAPRAHTRLLMPMIRDLLAEQGMVPAELDALAFACGPGSFTGLRIATGVVQGLAYGLDVPVIPVSSLSAVAADGIARFSLSEGEGIAVAFDARMGEIYWGCFVCRAGQPELIGDEQVCVPESLTLASGISSWFGVGQGWGLRDGFPANVTGAMKKIDDSLVPRASRVAELAGLALREGTGVSAAQAQPVYIRDEVAWKKLPGR
ncbi:tRNA (adenosine(37)-N6)-threonylcarbamoyltransferase complex dimerization subunit type 1 TsaB [Marinobacter orientalis]|uniref:tRNA threonylcarbamoyladenosine biosynthesis protein TsaB n=1 Tax=Marinobacter orientalis TaxID=1928859 RepID=A0A7Y0WSR3_9GAMM|nr:tRNA (adenosine(37)-N6)-threonylcarbamoyltransferase complex dimerization subunit type 1 TsaB [Marinobacter orientalis]NMT64178.1 tRNA (adenosine(37)-N6)-threonylcarbamoyltransferase complex dimerization subunit type 1 TsaB [Marinobacter orientalis]TGX49404.1 tRNA (adenosine(37)-N6)-threonylcarbamoyltransferase complex dimerization subunit type 1 TsaB [Marinobacter orientalis]